MFCKDVIDSLNFDDDFQQRGSFRKVILGGPPPNPRVSDAVLVPISFCCDVVKLVAVHFVLG